MNFAEDPWGVALVAAAGLCGLAVLWWLLAIMMRQPARGSGRLLSFGLFVYLGIAAGGTAVRVMAQAPPPPPAEPTGPPVVISAAVPTHDGKTADAKGDAKDAKGDAKRDAKAVDAKAVDAKADDAKAVDAKVDDAKADEPAPVEPPPVEPPPVEPPPAEPRKPSMPVVPEQHVELGAPTLAGREALRFIDAVSHDEARCRDVDEIAKAAREVPAMVPEVSASRAEKAADKLEACRKKLVWTRAYMIRQARLADREALADELPARLKAAHGLAVLITLRGPASQRIRIGGGGLDQTKAKEILDAGLRDELAGLGFEQVVLANMKTSYKEDLDVPSDTQLAARELGPKGLDRKIAVP